MKKQKNKKGSSIVELIIVTVLFAVLVPAALGIFLAGLKISGQGYIQHEAATALGETGDTIRFLRTRGFATLLAEGEEENTFYLVRTQEGHWLQKGSLTEELFSREITVNKSYRNNTTNDICTDYDPSSPDPNCNEDQNTRKITVKILWSPDYIPQEILTQVFYLTDWQRADIFYE